MMSDVRRMLSMGLPSFSFDIMVSLPKLLDMGLGAVDEARPEDMDD